MSTPRFHWHRFLEWVLDLLASRDFARGRARFDAARRHGDEADRLRPPPGPEGREPPAAPPREYDLRRSARLDNHDPASRLI